MRSYQDFIYGLEDELLNAVVDCEKMGFHHEHESSDIWQHYNRVVMWLLEVVERRQWYDNSTTAGEAPRRQQTRTEAFREVDRRSLQSADRGEFHRADRDDHQLTERGEEGSDGGQDHPRLHSGEQRT